MDPTTWKRICEVFESARRLRGEARDAVLAMVPDVEAEVRELLVEHEREEGAFAPRGVDPLIGTELGPYRVQGVLGQGGMATVYLAEGPEGAVAIKRLQPMLAREPLVRERFRREAELGAGLRHPHVVRTLGMLGEDCLLMELIEGVTLRTLLRDGGAMDEPQCLDVALQVTEALATIHDAGAVHRDVKPSNIIRQDDGRVKLMDLGIALPLNDMLRLSRTGEFIGTVRYSAPEHLAGRELPLDGRADLYALGLLLHECATGEHPYPDAGLVGTMRAHLEDEPEPLRARAPAASPGLARLVHDLLRKSPAERPPSAVAVGERIRTLIAAQ